MIRNLRLHFLFAAMGFAAMAAQIILMRRMVVCFGGNELMAGGVLAGWLFFSGLGSLIAGRFADHVRDADYAVAISLVVLALLIPITFVATYFVKIALGVPPPAMVGLWTALFTAILLLAPLGLAIGISFTLACRLPANNNASDIGTVYLFDALGAGLGGILISTIALKYISSMQSSILAALLLILILFVALPRRTIKIASFSSIIILAIFLWQASSLDSLLTSVQWQSYNAVAEKESLFSTLMVTENRGERTLFVDGRPSFSLPLPETYESIVHIPLLLHRNPKNIAIIEGGLSGIVGQLQNYKLTVVDFLRLDPEITVLEYDIMSGKAKHQPEWLRMHHADGRKFIRDQGMERNSNGVYDVITINVGEPDTASSDRYYTKEFFQEVSYALKSDGILCLTLMEPSNVVSKEAATLLGAIEATIRSVFPHVLLLPLDRYYFFASREQGILTSNPDELMQRLVARGIDADFLRSRILPGIFAERIAETQDIVHKAAQKSAINTDFAPRAYFNGLMLWERRGGYGASMMASISNLLRPWMFGVLLIFLTVVSIVILRKTNNDRVSITWALASIGFASMVYEIVLLIHYQMAVGLLIWKIGFIITAFMVGAGLGAWLAISSDKKIKSPGLVIVVSLIVAAIYIPLLFIMAKFSFIFANFGMGILTGFIYQRSASMIAINKKGVGAIAGIVQNADLLGASLGAIVASAIFVPLFGLYFALAAASAILVAAVAVILKN